MKPILLLLLSLVYNTTSFSQDKGNAQLYGYKEPVSSGISRKTIEEGAKNEAISFDPSMNYFIYLVTPARVYPSEMWINGKAYAVSIEAISTTPVIRENFNNPAGTKTELVPKTKDRVIRLMPIAAIEGKQSEKGASLASGNELVVVYKQNGKFYYNTLSSLTILDTAVMQ